MDFARFVQDYLNQQTEGDPSFMVSDEALAFVDLMRRDDMDRRASSVSQATSADNRGEPTHEEASSPGASPESSVGEEAQFAESVSESHDQAVPGSPIQESTEDPTPAVPVSEVALGADPLQAFASDSQEASAETAYQESSPEAQTEKLFTEEFDEAQPAGQPASQNASSPDAEPVSQDQTSQDDQAPDAALFAPGDEQNSDPAAATEQSSEDPPEKSQASAQSPESQSSTEDASVSPLFTDEAQRHGQTVPANVFQEEGVSITEVPNTHGSTTFIVPEGMPEFNDMLRVFDRDYRPPDPPAGDDIRIPPPPDLKDHEEIQSSCEHAEKMIAGMSHDLMNSARRRP